MMQDTPLDEPSFLERVRFSVTRKYQHLLDKSTVYLKARWASTAGLLAIYLLRVYSLQGWYIVTYGLGIFMLNLLIGFLSPQVDPETEGPILPSSSNGEFRPFSRRLSEFKYWHSNTRAIVIALFMTFFEFFNIPVFWPILLIYFIILFTLTMKRQIKHMWKHKYVPWSVGKKTYSRGPAK